jgi:hypothetical protein
MQAMQRGALAAGTVRPFAARAAPARRRAAAAARAAADRPIELHFGDTTVAFPLRRDQAAALTTAVAGVMRTFAEKAEAARPKRWDSMEFRAEGDGSAGEVELLEVVCNPNMAPTAFDARVLVTLRAGGVRLTTEGKLSALKADVEVHVDALRQAAG